MPNRPLFCLVRFFSFFIIGIECWQDSADCDAVEPGLSTYTSPGDPWDDWEYSDAGVARGTLSGGDKLLDVHLCGPAGVYMTVWWERARGTREGKYTWGLHQLL
jgi:hypothetical protein